MTTVRIHSGKRILRYNQNHGEGGKFASGTATAEPTVTAWADSRFPADERYAPGKAGVAFRIVSANDFSRIQASGRVDSHFEGMGHQAPGLYVTTDPHQLTEYGAATDVVMALHIEPDDGARLGGIAGVYRLDSLPADRIVGMYSGALRFNQNHDEHGRFGTGDGATLRPLVEPVSLLGGKYEGAGKTVFAVASTGPSATGGQLRMFVSEDLQPGKRPTPEMAQQALSTLADYNERYPVEGASMSIDVVSRETATAYTNDPNTIAWVSSGNGPATINFVERQPWTGASSGAMKEIKDGKVEYNVAHEYGHQWETFARQTGESGNRISIPAHANAMFKELNDQPRNGGMSSYGMTNAHEAFAEAFASYTRSGGETTNKAAQAYGEHFSW